MGLDRLRKMKSKRMGGEPIPQQQQAQPVYVEQPQVIQQPVYAEPVHQQQQPQHQQYHEPVQPQQPVYVEQPQYHEPVQQHQAPQYQEPVQQNQGPQYQEHNQYGYGEQPRQDNYNPYSMIPMRNYDPRRDRRSGTTLPSLCNVGRALTQEELKRHVIESLGLNPSSDIIVHQPKHINVEPLKFDVKDRTGLIAKKVEEAENKHGLSVIPFKVAGLNKFITEIVGYSIIEIDGEKCASSSERVVNRRLLDKYVDEFKDILSCGGIVDGYSLMTEFSHNDKIYNIPALNVYEIDELQNLFADFGAVSYIEDEEVKIAIGI